jgi:hypothetical protein
MDTVLNVLLLTFNVTYIMSLNSLLTVTRVETCCFITAISIYTSYKTNYFQM